MKKSRREFLKTATVSATALFADREDMMLFSLIISLLALITPAHRPPPHKVYNLAPSVTSPWSIAAASSLQGIKTANHPGTRRLSEKYAEATA